MSRQSKVNKDSYTQAGRLTQDDMARERQKQTNPATGATKERVRNRPADQPRQAAEQESTPARSAPEE